MITEKDFKIDVSDKGPYLIKGGVTIVLPDGSEEFKEKTVALYRCGHSSKKPYCDGSHRKHDNL